MRVPQPNYREVTAELRQLGKEKKKKKKKIWLRLANLFIRMDFIKKSILCIINFNGY